LCSHHWPSGDEGTGKTRSRACPGRKSRALCTAFRKQWRKSAVKAAAVLRGTRPCCCCRFVRLLVVIPPGGLCEVVVGAWHAGRRRDPGRRARSVSFGGVHRNRSLLPPATGSEDERKWQGQHKRTLDRHCRRGSRTVVCHSRTSLDQQATNAAYFQVRSDCGRCYTVTRL